MFKYLLSSLIIFVSLSNAILAQESKAAVRYDIFVDMKQIKLTDINALNFLRKSAFEVIFHAGAFKLLLSQKKPDKDNPYFEVIMKVTPSRKNDYNIEFSLMNQSVKELVNFVSAKNVNLPKVQFQSRKLLYELFFGENYTMESPVIPLFKDQDSADSKLNKSGLAAPVNASDAVAKMASDVDDNVTGEGNGDDDPNQQGGSNTPKNKKKKKNVVSIQNYDSPNIDLTKSPENVVKMEGPGIEIEGGYTFGIGFEDEYVASESSVVGVDTYFQRLTMRIGMQFKLKNWDSYLDLGIMLSKTMNTIEVNDQVFNPAPKAALTVEYNFAMFKPYVTIAPTLEYDNFSFINIAERGTQLHEYENNSLWIGVTLKGRIPIKKRIDVAAGIKRVFIGFSSIGLNNEQLPLEGNKLFARASIILWGKWGVGLYYEQANFSSVSVASFKTNHTVSGLTLNYN